MEQQNAQHNSCYPTNAIHSKVGKITLTFFCHTQMAGVKIRSTLQLHSVIKFLKSNLLRSILIPSVPCFCQTLSLMEVQTNSHHHLVGLSVNRLWLFKTFLELTSNHYGSPASVISYRMPSDETLR